MHYYSIPLFILFLTTTTTSLTQRHPCTDKFNELVKAKNFSNCHKLPTLGAELGWTISDSSSSGKAQSHHVVHVIFGAPMDEHKEMGWLAWGVNPGRWPEMVGTRAAIGIKDPSNGTLYCNTYNVTYETRIGCQLRPSAMEEIKCMGFEYDDTTQYHVLRATLNLSSANYNVSMMNIVWQIGFNVDGDRPQKHVATLKNVDSVETLDLLTGKSSDMAHLKIYLRQVHGVLNIIGWGTLLPVGVIIARFFRKFPFKNDWWFYTHVICQSVGFVLGVVGWGIGIWLAHISPRYTFLTHRVLAILIFAFATLQTLAIRLRPSPTDDFRNVWNIYHHFLGYALIALMFINIFEGIRILKPENREKWKFAVIGILIALGFITLILESFTWIKFYGERTKSKESESLSHSSKHEEEDLGGGIQPSSSERNTLATSPALETLNIYKK